MTSLCPRSVLGYHFLPSLLRSVFNGARQARPGTEAAGLSWPGSPLDPTPRGAVQLPVLRPLTSARSLSRGCRSASNVGAQAGRTRRGEAGSLQANSQSPKKPLGFGRGGGSGRDRSPSGAGASSFASPHGEGEWFSILG